MAQDTDPDIVLTKMLKKKRKREKEKYLIA